MSNDTLFIIYFYGIIYLIIVVGLSLYNIYLQYQRAISIISGFPH
jgi:hypothetical protein